MRYYDNVVKAIDHYMQDESLNNAFFLNGKWGSGKSYFVTNILSKHLENQYEHKVIYVSLYGIVNVDEIAKQIYSKLIAESRIKKQKSKMSLKTRSIVSEYTKDTAIATAKNLIPMLLSKVYITLPKIEDYWKYITLQKNILVFDDLERSRIDIVELMGYINNFVEEYGIKTIVVGNEDEIKQRFYMDNFVEKINIVKDLKLPINNDQEKEKYRGILFKESEIIENNANGFISTNLNTLSKKIEYLFSTYEKYDKIKEKLIGYTFQYSPPIRELFERLSDDIVVKRNLDFIERIYRKRNCFNLRTFIFSKHSFIQIKDSILKLNLTNTDDLLDVIVENIFYCSLELKNPLDVRNKNPYETITSSNNNVPQSVKNGIHEIISEYINTLKLNFDFFKFSLIEYDKLISDYICENNNSLKKLQTYWLDKDDNYIDSSVNEVLEMLKNNSLNIQNYPTLISYIYLYNEIFESTKHDIDEIIEQMVENVKRSKDKIPQDFGVNTHISCWPNNKEEMKQKLDYLHHEIDTHNLSIVDQSINSYLMNENWSASLLENLKDEKLAWKFTTDKNFVSLIDVEKLANLIISGTPEDLSNLQQAFKFVYSFSNLNEFFQNDLENLKKLTDLLLENISKVKSRILAYSIKMFVAYLDDKIKIIRQNNN